MNRRTILLSIVILLQTLAACAPLKNSEEVPTQRVTVVEVTRETQMDCPPTSAPTELTCPTPQVNEEIGTQLRAAQVSSGSLALRAGPTVAHPALGSYPLGADVKILGKAPGGSWSAVSVPGGQLGWMYTLYLGVAIDDPLNDVPVLEPAGSRTIAGQVVDDSGQPVGNVGVTVALGGPVDYPDYTDEDGNFAVFVPDTQSGPWDVSIQGVGCLSRLVDEDCQLMEHILRNPRQTYQVGQSQDLTFVYEATTMKLTGRVVDNAGDPYAGAGVFATRSDGAYVTAKADSAGLFTIPITPGSWSLMATRGQPKRITVPESGFGEELVLVGVPN